MPKKNLNKMNIIGLTGGLATGKTTVAEILRSLGHVVVCTDAIAHDVIKPGQPALKKIVAEFGSTILDNGTLDRKKMADLVFPKPLKRKKLEAIIHPYVRKEVKKIIAVFKKQGLKTLFIDVPLLFETDFYTLCDQTICVTAPQYLQIERARKYRKMTQKEALARIKSQMPLKKKEKKADFVVVNKGTKQVLSTQIKKTAKSL
jgi:dephospho-CoA kinase